MKRIGFIGSHVKKPELQFSHSQSLTAAMSLIPAAALDSLAPGFHASHLLGPWRGQLAAAGGSVTLKKVI